MTSRARARGSGSGLGARARGWGSGLGLDPCVRLARGFAKSWRSFFENEPKMTQTSTEAVFLSSKSTKIAFLI